MGGLKKGTGSLNFEDEEQTDDHEEEQEQGQEQQTGIETKSETRDTDTSTDSPAQPDAHETVPGQGHTRDSKSRAETRAATSSASPVDPTPQEPNFDMDNLPYLVQRQMRGASVNADRTNQLLLEVRPFVKDDEDTFLDDLKGLVDGPVYKGDAREAAMIVAQENPELVADKLREWGIEYLDT